MEITTPQECKECFEKLGNLTNSYFGGVLLLRKVAGFHQTWMGRSAKCPSFLEEDKRIIIMLLTTMVPKGDQYL